MIRYPYIAVMGLIAALGGVGIAPSQALAGGESEFLGTVMGAGLGGFLGSQVGHGAGRLAATGTGVFLGGWVGNSLGRSADRQAYYAHPPRRAYYAPAYSTVYEETYLPPSYVMTYYAPNYVAPPAPQPPPPSTIYVDDSSGSYCREYSQQIRIGDQVQESYGTACMQPDGSWKIVQ